MIFNFRYKRFEKAFLLAVDIGAKDLFMVSCSPIFIIFFTGIAYKAENASFHCSTIKTFYLCRLLTKNKVYVKLYKGARCFIYLHRQK